MRARRRFHGELFVLGIRIAPSTVWQVLKDAGIDLAPERSSTRSTFLRSQADGLLACDFFETRALTDTRLYVLAVIEHTSRRIRVLGAPRTRPPPGHPSRQHLVMDLEEKADTRGS